MSLFNNQVIGIGLSASGSNTEPTAEITMGEAKMLCPLIDVRGGAQADRIQIDVALNGNVNVTGSINSGLSVYSMTFLDGPQIPANSLFQDAENGAVHSAMTKYLQSTSIADRVIKIKLFPGVIACQQPSASTNQVATSKPLATFNGVATAVDIVISSEESGSGSLRTMQTRITATGAWSSGN
jgi:hypothetical protein